MKEFFNRLNPMERRFVVGVGVAFFLVLNVVFVWPHFGDFSATQKAMDDARRQENLFQDGINRMPEVQKAIARYQDQNQVVPAEDQALQFFRMIVNQSAASRVGIINQGSMRQSLNTNNPYFMEQNQTITTSSGEKELVDFLYNMGNGNSFIRVKDLSIQPDQPHQQLTARVTLVASYQKKVPGPGPAAPTSAGAKTAASAPAKAPPTPAKAQPVPASLKPPVPNPAGAPPKPGTPKPVPPNPMNHGATNKLNPLMPNKR